MHRIEVLGFDCPTCRKAYSRIESVAQAMGIAIRLEKISDPARILAYQVLRPPGVAVDGKLVFSGGVPDRRAIEGWLRQSS